MKSHKPLFCERLEDRATPALTASLGATGLLTISGVADNGSIAITQDATTAGTFNVSDGSTAVTGSPFTGVTDIRLNLTSADDHVTIDLGGQAMSGNVTTNLGAGANTLMVSNGDIGGTLAVSGEAIMNQGHNGNGNGNGDDDHDDDHGHGHGNGFANGGNGNGGNGFVQDTAPDAITLAADATAGNVIVRVGTGGATVGLAGDVNGNVVIGAFHGNRSSDGTTVMAAGGINGALLFIGSSQDDLLDVTGDVGRSVLAATFGGNDTVMVGGTVANRLILDTGSGNDSISVDGLVGGRTLINAGSGNDTVTISATAQLAAPAAISLGSGNDTLVLDPAADILSLFASGGSGMDTFTGTVVPGVHVFGF